MNIGKRECRRCGRPFTPIQEGQEYGEKCMRKMAGQTILQDRYVVPPRKKRRKKPIAKELIDIAGTLNDDEVAWV